MGPRNPRSIEVAGVIHGAAPIPMGARVGNLVYSSGVPGVDPATGKMAQGSKAQAHHAFGNLRALLASAGASLDDLVRLTVYVKDDSARAALNEEWLKAFPDPHDRPARHTLVHDLQNGMLLQLDAVAVVQT